ncbi:hypothetical protein [Priestia aryabhattai]|uniref:Uncharacterized protein n=1 Tax=Priestia aryabhattai TaxID=412384 RepID=A0ABD7X3A8_PRIAR|nr:hypothetical protein [Priestia aryabhattai]WEA47199.1 hypothetical protein PWO00_27520 [Priestia aryabhattai]
MLKDDELFDWDSSYEETEEDERDETFENYINITSHFTKGLKKYLLEHRQVDMKEVVEVFAGNGKLGQDLGLDNENYFYNITDSYDYTSEDVIEDEVCEFWDVEYSHVTNESAEDTVIRFKGSNKVIKFLIMGAPPKALRDSGDVSYCGAYNASKALHYLYNGDAQIIYIGNERIADFASELFFKHVEEIEDRDFNDNVVENYLNEGYFPYIYIEDVQPYLYKFSLCENDRCDCRDSSSIVNSASIFNLEKWEKEREMEIEDYLTGGDEDWD